MNKEALTKLANFLDKVPEDRFNIHEWIVEQAESDFNEKFDCGFAGCAIGWAVHAKVVPGLEWCNGEPSYRYEFGWVVGWSAVRLAFDIDDLIASKLFTGTTYEGICTPADVAKRIRQFVETGELVETGEVE